eukprot:TRINITY_DN275_c0_g2_i2.p1 TRINITY_DN275_c0_g2~~TRINITY_DN275_c0_g2_i2.p1  ORF type:complete len:316 (-),score=34.30 TRINITY_DN275_c0_g2_i2:59-1006(-)
MASNARQNDKSAAIRKSSHEFRLQKGSLHQPTIAWPTVILAIVSIALWLGAAYAGIVWSAPLWMTFPLSTLSTYLAFTPMHDATHSSVARRPYRWVNESIGWLCSVPLLAAPHSIFRWLHLRHHKFTNDPDLDPDYVRPHEGCLVLVLLPVDMASAICNWIGTIRRYGDSMDESTRTSAAVFFGVELAFASFAIQYGYGVCLLLYWVLPTISAVVFLAYVFDHVPHHPRKTTASESVYASTGTLDGLFGIGSGESWWVFTWVTLGQNYHSIHHIFPTLPWYAYEKVWQAHHEAFLKAGVPLTTLFGRQDDGSKAD